MTSRLQHLLSFLTSDPQDDFVLFAIAKEYESLGQAEQALSFYLKTQTANPNNVGLYYHLAKLQLQLGQHEQAVQTYELGMKIAREIGDHHALSELMGAYEQLLDED